MKGKLVELKKLFITSSPWYSCIITIRKCQNKSGKAQEITRYGSNLTFDLKVITMFLPSLRFMGQVNDGKHSFECLWGGTGLSGDYGIFTACLPNLSSTGTEVWVS